MRKRVTPPVGFVDTQDAAPICGLSVKSLGVYRQPGYTRFGPPWHYFDNAPVYSVSELRAWACARAEKAKAKAAELERLAEADMLREILS